MVCSVGFLLHLDYFYFFQNGPFNLYTMALKMDQII